MPISHNPTAITQHKEFDFQIRCLRLVPRNNKAINEYVLTVEGPQLLPPILFTLTLGEGRGLFAREGCFHRNQPYQNYTGFSTKMLVGRSHMIHT